MHREHFVYQRTGWRGECFWAGGKSICDSSGASASRRSIDHELVKPITDEIYSTSKNLDRNDDDCEQRAEHGQTSENAFADWAARVTLDVVRVIHQNEKRQDQKWHDDNRQRH